MAGCCDRTFSTPVKTSPLGRFRSASPWAVEGKQLGSIQRVRVSSLCDILPESNDWGAPNHGRGCAGSERPGVVRPVLGLAHVLTGNPSLAEELVQLTARS